MLVDQRNGWRKAFESGKAIESILLKEYKNNRESNSFRMTRSVEELCEYILYLEDKVK